MKSEVVVGRSLPEGPDTEGPWAARGRDGFAQQRSWVRRVEGLAGSRVRRLLGDIVVDPAGPQKVVVAVEFDPAKRLWSVRKAQDGRCLTVQLFVPEAVKELLTVDHAATYVQGVAGSVVAERLGVEPRMQLVEGGPFPLASIVAVPRSGASDAWHRDPDIDSFAKTVSAMDGMWRRSAQWGKAMAGWPVLELVPRKGVGTAGCLPGCGRIAVKVGGFSQRSDQEKVRVVLDGVRVGVGGQWGGARPGSGSDADLVEAAIPDWIDVHGLQDHWVSPDLRDGGLPVAHPAFVAHFVGSLYDDDGADFGPFGSDEGFELVREWGGRRAELGAGSTVAELLGEPGAEVVGRWLQPVDPSVCRDAAGLVDEAVWVQSAGFALLRLAGRIDVEGRVATLHALEFLIGFYGAPVEYVTQRDDLARWQTR